MEQHAAHPDDERLAAFADGTPEAVGDASLLAHVDTCARCSSTVADLRRLQSALAELPDLAPPRPLRLVPPVTAPAGRGIGLIARRLVAPVLVAGIALSVVGGAGSLASLGSLMGASGGAAPVEQSTATDAALQPVAAGASAAPSAGEIAAPSAAASAGEVARDTDSSAEGHPALLRALAEPARQLAVWPALLVAGLVLMGLALLLRFVVRPRAT